jgi:endonuclease-3 related protein
VSRPDGDAARVRDVYRVLRETYDYEAWHWSPRFVRRPFDVIAGALLVQHTTWINAERALDAMRDAGALEPRALASMPPDELVALIRVAGTPSIKARRLYAVAAMIEDAGGLDALFRLPTDDLRVRLLATHGIGPETADAILLYAAGRRSFEIDAYTQRLFRRLGTGPDEDGYGTWQRWFEDALPDADAEVFRRYHAYIVLHGKALCRATPICEPCPLLPQCPYGQERTAAGKMRPAERGRRRAEAAR